MLELMLAQVSVDDTPYPPRQLLEGQTPYDWDNDGLKVSPRDDLTEGLNPKLNILDKVATDIAVTSEFTQDILEGAIRPSKLLGVATPAPRADTVLPLPEDFKEVITN